MNGLNRILLDTNAVIFLLQGDAKLNALAAEAGWLGVSVITPIEFLAFPDITVQDTDLLKAFLRRVEVIDLRHDDKRLIQTAVELRHIQSLKLPDAIIAATAIAYGATLLTADKKLLQLSGRIRGFSAR